MPTYLADVTVSRVMCGSCTLLILAWFFLVKMSLECIRVSVVPMTLHLTPSTFVESC